MNLSDKLPAIGVLKNRARHLRQQLADDGQTISHSRSLELTAHQFGFKDWNTLSALAGDASTEAPVEPGDNVSGRYLGQSFKGEVLDVRADNQPDMYRLTVRFDEPMDVVKFDSFSSFRQRVSCIIDSSGKTAQKTSDGRPHMELLL